MFLKTEQKLKHMEVMQTKLRQWYFCIAKCANTNFKTQ